jgi:hypothetical protein
VPFTVLLLVVVVLEVIVAQAPRRVDDLAGHGLC